MTATTAASPVLIRGEWREAEAGRTFSATNPRLGESLEGAYPVSSWSDLDAALEAAATAFRELTATPREAITGFLLTYADLIEQRADAIAEAAHLETGLPVEPRLKNVELPRTTNQLRQAAAAATDVSWRTPVSDDEANLHSVLEPLGPVLVFGPNNFPLAFNAISGGDFAAAIAAGCPVIAKSHELHPTTSRLLAEAAHEAAADLPAGTVQMLYSAAPEDGLRAVADPRLGAVAFTGSRAGGLALKRAADEVGKPFFAELSAINPVVILPGALAERFDAVVDETVTSALMAAGQFCTNPGLLVLLRDGVTDRFIGELGQRYAAAACGPLFGERVLASLVDSIRRLTAAGAEVVTGGAPAEGGPCTHQNTLLKVRAEQFLAAAGELQTEAFGNCTVALVCEDVAEVAEVLRTLEGSLTGCVYSATDGSEDDAYTAVAAELTPRVGRLLNDKMPTGVAVSPAMNHGGPFPATTAPHFTAVGLPAACRRFTRLVCYDGVRAHRLPSAMRR